MVGRKPYIPERGHVVWLDFDPQRGHEQAGRRPALVLSPRLYNRSSGLALLCPITNQAKGYPYEVPIPEEVDGVQGVILTDQLKSLAWKERKAEYLCDAPVELLAEVVEKLLTLVDPEDDPSPGS